MNSLKNKIFLIFILIVYISCNFNKNKKEPSKNFKDKNIDSYYYLEDESMDDEDAGEGGGSFYLESLLELNKIDSTYYFTIKEKSGCENFDLKSEGVWKIRKNKIIFYDNDKNEFDKIKAKIKNNILKFEIHSDLEYINRVLNQLILVKNDSVTKAYIE